MSLVEIPQERLHDSGNAAPLGGILIALTTTIVGVALLGAGYGAVMALSGNVWFNLCLAGSLPFWVNIPEGFGALFGHLQAPKWRTGIRLIGFVTCLYAICVGWVLGVLDGPGLVFDPVELLGHMANPRLYGLWVINWDLESEINNLAPYLMVMRCGEMLWIAKASLMSGGGPLPFPFCQDCKCFMWDSADIRLKYDPPTHNEAELLTRAIVNEQYGPLLLLNEPVECPKDKGLDINVFRCEKCEKRHVLNARWFPPSPDPEKSEVINLLEPHSGIELVHDLLVPEEIYHHFKHLVALQEQEESSSNKKAA